MDLETARKVLTHTDKLIAAAVARAQRSDAEHDYEMAAIALRTAGTLMEGKALIIGSLETEIAEELLEL